MARKRYSREFRKEAARMLIMEGQKAKEVSEQLDVPATMLYRWKKEHLEELEGSKPEGSASPKEMAIEIDKLRKQLGKSERINQILKKTVVYFAKEQ